MDDDLLIRDTVQATDIDLVRRLVESAGNFYPKEIEVAVELIEEAWRRGPASGYLFVFAETPQTCLGFACYGAIPLTEASYDLYWIVVERTCRGRGVGRRLLQEVEQRVRSGGGRRLYIDTSGRQAYAATRRFYERQGYQVAAELPDFYAIGDAKIIYSKQLT